MPWQFSAWIVMGDWALQWCDQFAFLVNPSGLWHESQARLPHFHPNTASAKCPFKISCMLRLFPSSQKWEECEWWWNFFLNASHLIETSKRELSGGLGVTQGSYLLWMRKMGTNGRAGEEEATMWEFKGGGGPFIVTSFHSLQYNG